jgi:hypothetical protein
MKRMRIWLCLGLLWALVSVGQGLAAPAVLFDEGHGQPFLAGGAGPLDLSALAGSFVGAGCTVHTTMQPLDAGQLAGRDVLIISGAFRPLTPAELAAVKDFLEAGGSLAVMLHIAPPLAGLLDLLQVDYANGILHDHQHAISGNSQNFKVVELAAHPLTESAEPFSVYGTWALRGLAPSVAVVAGSSPQGWVDLNHDDRLTPGDAVGSFGVLAAGTVGRGRFVVCGDDALFQNRFFDAGNRRLAERLVAWLVGASPG